MMKRYIFLLITCNILFAQVSINDIDDVRNQQLDDIKSKLETSNKSDDQKRVPSDIQNELKQISIKTPDSKEDDEYFGYNYLKKDISFFDNIPTPADYRIGPGDEVIISLWGENNSRENFIINKDGNIYYPNIGFLNLSNQTIESAENILIEELSRVYATLKDNENSTRLMLSLGKLKSINIYFSGHIENPGINLVHPFSDVFSAIIQAGGINKRGSLREVQLIRNGELFSTIDFYSFFLNGKNTFSNIKLIDGDVIHVPNFKNRVSISGEVNRPSTYELLPGESLSDLISFSSGFTSSASSSIIINQITPPDKRTSDDNARTSTATSFKNEKSVTLNNGDTINVLPITPVDLSVEVFGRVKLPGRYPASNLTLKNILDLAGGFDDPVFRKSINEEIVILRNDDNQYYANELLVYYKEADKFQLEPNDKIFVYENIKYKQSMTYRIEGEVFSPGTYSSRKGITVGEAIDLAGGITEMSTLANINVFQEFTYLDESGNKINDYYQVSNTNLDFQITPNTVIRVLPFENVINVKGNVYNPGLIAYKNNLTLSKAIFLAGGYKPDSLKRKTYVQRANGKVEKSGIFLGRTKRLYAGDTIVVPVDPEPTDFDFTNFISELSSTLANLAAILILVENQNN